MICTENKLSFRSLPPAQCLEQCGNRNVIAKCEADSFIAKADNGSLIGESV